MLNQLTDRLLPDWLDLFPDAKRPERLDYLCVSGSIEGGTTTFLAFAEGAKTPVFVVKVHRSAETAGRARKEKQVLDRLQNGPLRSVVPRAVLCENIAGSAVLVQTVLPGKPMMARLNRSGYPEEAGTAGNIALAASFLKDLKKEYGAVDPGPARACAAHQEEIALFSDVFRLGGRYGGYFDELGAYIGNFISSRRMAWIRHGDFCRHNILLNKSLFLPEKASVIDWTFADREWLPLHDLFFFLGTYFLQIRAHEGVEGFTAAFKETFLSRNRYSAQIRSCVHEFCRDLEIDPGAVHFHFGMFLIEQAMFEFEQLRVCSGEGGLPRITVFLSLSQGGNYGDALKAQLWIHYFQSFMDMKTSFIL